MAVGRVSPPTVQGGASIATPSRAAWRSLLVGGLLGLAVVAGALLGRSAAATPEDRSAEAGFARDMAAHHDQAVAMSIIALERSENPAVAGLAKDILLTQQNQIGQMFGWLDLWRLPLAGSEPQMAWMGHDVDGRMPGMASPEEIARLAQLSGDELDGEFLRLMIRHHEGGMPMARAILERSDLRAVRELAGAIVASQQAEVATMRWMLAATGDAAVLPPA